MARNNIFNQPKQNTPKHNTKSQAKSILDSKAVNDLVKTSKSNRQNTTSDSIGNRSDNNSTTDSNPYKHPIVKDNRVINIQNLRPVTTKEEAREDDGEPEQPAQPAQPAEPESQVQEPAGKTVVSKTPVYNCDGSGHGYYEITYSDGSTEYEEF